MRIVVDLQGAQSTGSRQRGIGRYSVALATALAARPGKHDIILALSALFPETIEPLRAKFDRLLPQANIQVWRAPGPVAAIHPDNRWRRRSAELVREAFLTSLNPDAVLVTSVFEGLDDDAVTSIGMLSRLVPTAAVLYDLIPLIYRRPYLESPSVESWYENKLDQLRRADLLLSISESSRQEAIRHLDFPADAIVNISTAADRRFTPCRLDDRAESDLRRRYGLPRPFVMYTGGIDHRKNVEGLIRAYSRLPRSLRTSHHLAVVCSVQPESRRALESLARKQELAAGEFVLTGFVPDEDLVGLYNLCKAFVFPSRHEGFGLPALEAMSCGCAVIGANTSSIPEVIGRHDALFDPRNDASLAAKLEQVLVDEEFRRDLEAHGLRRAGQFTWESTARRAIEAFESVDVDGRTTQWTECIRQRRPKLACVTPVPPLRSGISDYSAELLPELSRHYDIDVILAQDSVSAPWMEANCGIRHVRWFRENWREFDRILYHFGNSPFHSHMFDLLQEVPGIVVLHDFFLSHALAHGVGSDDGTERWRLELYHSHGYAALAEQFHGADATEGLWRYPCNLKVIQRAIGVIVHSGYSRRLAEHWYGSGAGEDWPIVPLLRRVEIGADRVAARLALDLAEDAFVVCSFGMMGPTKLNHRLVAAWLMSALAEDPKGVLVFVGEAASGEYGMEIADAIRQSGRGKRIRITGWQDTTAFQQYLAAADAAVQLRGRSRGETSRAVLDCMSHGIPTIVNANGSFADLNDDAVLKLGDDFQDAELAAALELLWNGVERREVLGARAREEIRLRHSPRACADEYAAVMEAAYRGKPHHVLKLAGAIAEVEPRAVDDASWSCLAVDIAQSLAPRPRQAQVLVDVSILAQHDAKSGIQRVVRGVLRELLTRPPPGFRVEPIAAMGGQQYRYARGFAWQFLKCGNAEHGDTVVEFHSGDIFLGLDLAHDVVRSHASTYDEMRCRGVAVWFVVYDLLPVLRREMFEEQMTGLHEEWLRVVVSKGDGAVCISETVAAELSVWVERESVVRSRPLRISSFALGADIESSLPSSGIEDRAAEVLEVLSKRPSFLMVGTLEPRKGHGQVLEAFEALWSEGLEANLVIVGKRGWLRDALMQRLRSHPERGTRLFWLEGISDEYLERVYEACTCLVAASVGEGFGLPLIEAAQRGLPIIARDIPVFREVAGEHAYYFSGMGPQAVATAVRRWIALKAEGKTPSSEGIRWLTWRESARLLMDAILCKEGREVYAAGRDGSDA